MSQFYCHNCGEERRVTNESVRSQYPHFCHLCRKQAERGTLKTYTTLATPMLITPWCDWCLERHAANAHKTRLQTYCPLCEQYHYPEGPHTKGILGFFRNDDARLRDLRRFEKRLSERINPPYRCLTQ